MISFCPQCGTEVQARFVFGKMRPVCPACNYVHFRDPKVAACALVTQGDQILLVKRAVEPELGKWALPAGFVDYGEDPALAAVRETHEETGLQVEVTALFEVMFQQDTHPVIVMIYWTKVIGGILEAADDAEAAQWFSRGDLPEVAFESTRRALTAWLEQGAGVHP